MEIQGAGLLYTLATCAVTFAGFAVLLLALRQAAGAVLSPLDRFLARTVVGHFFWIAAGALFPPAIALYALSAGAVWKVSALLFGPPMLWLMLTYQRRRFAITGKRAPPIILILFVGTSSLSVAAMMACVFSSFPNPEAAYASAILITFLSHGFAVLVALEVIFTQQSATARTRRKAAS